MPSLIGPEGDAALSALLQRQPLLAFDFDGTLAPIVPHPDAAQVPASLAPMLQALALRLPVAVVSGRAVGDVRSRLGFVPTYIIGNHGAEDEGELEATQRHSAVLDPLRQRLHERQAELAAAGVWVEDKGPSVALHYRMSRTPEHALALVDDLLRQDGAPWRVFGGKMVANAVAADAPDKARAVHDLVARSGTGAAFFAGDDVNDEPVFAAARDDWLTVRVGRDDTPTLARWSVDSPQQMASVVERLLALVTLGEMGLKLG